MPLPEWTERSETRGLDPLGLQNGGVQLYQELLPGISNVTLRIRYYGLYCWASEAYAREVGSTNPDEWRTWVRRLEALFALTAVAAGGEGGVAGVEWAARRLATGDDPVDFSVGASTDRREDVYLGQSLGVFGQAYLSQMVEMGLFGPAKGHAIPLRSERGLALAEAFGDSIGPEVATLVIRCIRSAVASRAELDLLRPILPSSIPDGAERSGYRGVLFAEGGEEGDAARSRRDTLLLILHCADAGARRPNAASLRRRLFASEVPLPVGLEPQRLRWEAYQAQDMWQVAAAALLRWSLSIIDEVDGGLPLPVVRAEVASRLQESVAWAGTPWADWREAVPVQDADFDERQRRILSGRELAEQRAMAAIEQMAALDQRVRSSARLSDEIARSFATGGGGRTIRSELAWTAARERRPVVDVVAEMVVDRVMRRHTWVATQKLRRQRDYTFLFESRDGRLAFRAQYDPVLTTPRLDPAVQFLADLGLIGADGCTPAGVAVLEGCA